MQPVHFPCGHCGKLMGVQSEHLGQQVRCPHCQQIVVAPQPSASGTAVEGTEASPPALFAAESQTPARVGEIEDIFSTTEVSEDLFGRGEAPRLEIPPESPPPTLPGDNAAAPPAPQPNLTPTMPWAPQEGSAASWMSGTATETLPPPPGEVPAADSRSESATSSVRVRQRTEAKAPWFLLLVFCPLLLYALVISIFAYFLYRHDQQLREQLRNPFEKMPDVGDDPGIRKGKKVSLTDHYKPELAELPLPDYLCTTLGKPLRIGELQVTPNRIERKRVLVKVGKTKPEPCQNDSLVLYLDLKNCSPDYAFAPLDNYFDRYWRPGQDMIPPLTQLEIGEQGQRYRCYGGPAHWYPREYRSELRQWIQGRHEQGDFLQPGEEKQLFVCTDGDDDRAAALLFGQQAGAEYHGSLLWRVRVRRGLVSFEGKNYSATAVVGVRFRDTDIHEAAPEVR